MKQGIVLVALVKLFGLCIVGWLLWLFIFSACTPMDQETIPDILTFLSMVLGVLTGMIVSIGISYNNAVRKGNQLKASASNILIAEERGNSLLEKANRVVFKYLSHEKEVYTEQGGTHVKPVNDAHQFQYLIESYPVLRSNGNIVELLDQIKECETAIANNKMHYNSDVESYNTLVHSIPLSLFKRFFTFSEAEYYQKKPLEMTDDRLGI